MRLNVGCGKHTLDGGWTNIDAVRSPLAPRAPEIFADVGAIPLPDGCADELMAIHVFEHVYRWDSEKVLAEWARLLKSGGRLILEMPDLIKCCKNVIAGRPDQMGMWGLYGDPKLEDTYMVHRWLWTMKSITPLLVKAGFTDIVEKPTQWHPAGRLHRDFRVEATRL